MKLRLTLDQAAEPLCVSASRSNANILSFSVLSISQSLRFCPPSLGLIRAIRPRYTKLLTSNASVIFTDVGALANWNVVIEKHLEDLSDIGVRANEPKPPPGPCLLERKLCAAADVRSSFTRASEAAAYQNKRSDCV